MPMPDGAAQPAGPRTAAPAVPPRWRRIAARDRFVPATLALLVALDLVVALAVPLARAALAGPMEVQLVTAPCPGCPLETRNETVPPIPFGMAARGVWNDYVGQHLPDKLFGLHLVAPGFLWGVGPGLLWLAGLASLPGVLLWARGVTLWRRVPYAAFAALWVSGLFNSAWSTIGE